MLNAHAGEVAMTWRGQPYKLVFDFAAIKTFERDGQSLFAALDHLQAVALSGQVNPKTGVMRPVTMPRVAMIAELISAGLQRHHPDVTPEAAVEMIGDADVWSALFAGYEAAMPPSKPGGDAADPFPTAPQARVKNPRTAKKRASTGKR